MAQWMQNLHSGFEQYILTSLPGMFFALAAALGVLLFFVSYWRALRPRQDSLEWVALQEKPSTPFSLPYHPMRKSDLLPLLLLTAVYAATAFFRLGSFTNPQSVLDLGNGQSVEITLADTVYLATLEYYPELGTGSYNVEISRDGKTWSTLWARKGDDGKVTGYYWASAEGYAPSYALPQKYSDLFKWLEIKPENPQNVRYLRITGKSEKDLLQLGELALYGQNGSLIGSPSLGDSARSTALFDEQGTVPEQASWYNSTYFDEIYHARTALEHIEGVYPYEVTHPPLGKLILSLGIRLFGMTPFGWRFMGTLFGVLMVPALYVFLKNLFGKTAVAFCGTTLFTFDFMHLTQTRIATIDTYGVIFILLMYYFLYRYLALPPPAPEGPPQPDFRGKKGYLFLFLSGLFWGIGAASKWTVIYAAAGLALLYFIGLFSRLRHWPPEGPRPTAWLVKTLLFSLLCFVLIPAVIYCASYIPYAQAKGEVNLKGLLDIMINNQIFMFTYHEGVHTPHPYSSRWFQWLVDARPILYFLDNTTGADQGLKSAFAAFNNPLVSWGGLLAVLTLLYRGLQGFFQRATRRSVSLPPMGSVALFIVIGYFSQLLPWMLIGRITFAYHYFPSTLFLTFGLTFVFYELSERCPGSWKRPVYTFTAATAGLYAAFYPVLIGLSVPVYYTSNFLKWFPSWPF